MKTLLALFTAIAATLAPAAESRIRININPVWRFQLGEPPETPVLPGFDDKSWEIVSLPHTHQVFPADLSGFIEHGRQVGWYRRTLDVPGTWSGKRVFLEFQGAMQTTKLWVNGSPAGEYSTGGYDSFHFDITDQLKPGPNQLAIRIDNTVNPAIPPSRRTARKPISSSSAACIGMSMSSSPIRSTSASHGRRSRPASVSRCPGFPKPAPPFSRKPM